MGVFEPVDRTGDTGRLGVLSCYFSLFLLYFRQHMSIKERVKELRDRGKRLKQEREIERRRELGRDKDFQKRIREAGFESADDYRTYCQTVDGWNQRKGLLEQADRRITESGAFGIAQEVRDLIAGAELTVVPKLSERIKFDPDNFNSVLVEVRWNVKNHVTDFKMSVGEAIAGPTHPYAGSKVKWQSWQVFRIIAPTASSDLRVEIGRRTSYPADALSYSGAEHGETKYERTFSEKEWKRNLFEDAIARLLWESGILRK